MSGHGRGIYETDVFADSADEAIEIAAEGLPPEAELTTAEAIPHPSGPEGNWAVSLKFKGGKKKARPSEPRIR
jgi:hypothetical protein